MPNGEKTRDMEVCIDNCVECHRICAEMVPHCLGIGGEHAAPEQIRLLIDCAEICRTSADFMIRGSDLHTHICGACAEVCDRCAEECERLAGDDDEMMSRCVEICRKCTDSCFQMARLSHS